MNITRHYYKGIVLAVFVIVLTAPALFGDVVIKKDGRRLEGTIVSTSPEQVAIEVEGIIIYINRREIDKIIRDERPALVRQAEVAIENQEFQIALDKAIDILKEEPSFSEDANRFFYASLKQLQQEAIDSLARNEYDTAIRVNSFLLDHIQSEFVRTRFFDSQEIWSMYSSEFKENLARAYLSRANQNIIKNKEEEYPSIKQDLLQVLEYSSSHSPRAYTARLFLGNICMALGDYEEAQQYLERVSRESSYPEQRQQAQFLLTQLRQKIGNQPPRAPTPTQRRVVPRATQQPAQQRIHPPEPPPEEGRTIPKWKRLFLEVRYHEYVQEAEDFAIEFAQGEYMAYVAIPVVLFLLWFISHKIFKIKARRGDILAGSMLSMAKKLGPLTFLVYPLKRLRLGSPKKRCPFCGKGIDDIESYTDLNFYVCPHCRENISPVFEPSDYIQHLVKSVEKGLHSKGKKKRTASDGTIVEKDAMLKLVRSIITYAVRRRASDLHIEQEVDRLKIRARIDGILFDIFSFPKAIANPVVSAIKVMANLDIAERRIPQDGQFSIWVDRTDIDVRVATSPAAMGEKISLRLLDIRTIMVDSTKLGLEGTNLEKFERTIRKPHGLVLVTGPSGSGKTTSLYVALNSINTGEKNIITIEDPVEYHIKGLNQLQLNPGADFTFATGLRSILRQDPDVIMVGEIRDSEAADIAIEAALTGHLVFSTLHTIDAAGAIGRLIDLGIEPKRFVPALLAVIAQRLVRINCPECKRPYKPKRSNLEALGISQAEAQEITFMKGGGCPACFNSGFLDRIGIFEILTPDEEMKDMLETNLASSVIRELARKSGMRTLREEGILKIKQGLTTVEEIIRVTS